MKDWDLLQLSSRDPNGNFVHAPCAPIPNVSDPMMTEAILCNEDLNWQISLAATTSRQGLVQWRLLMHVHDERYGGMALLLYSQIALISSL